MDWKGWLKSLIAAAIGGAAHSITVMIIDPNTFNFQNGTGKLIAVMGVGALLQVAMYLQQSPIPETKKNEKD